MYTCTKSRATFSLSFAVSLKTSSVKYYNFGDSLQQRKSETKSTSDPCSFPSGKQFTFLLWRRYAILPKNWKSQVKVKVKLAPGTGIMEDDDRQVTTVFTIRHSTIGTRQIESHEALPSSANVQSHLTSPTMATLHDTRFFEYRWWNDGWTVKTVVVWRSSASMVPAQGVSPFGRCKTANRFGGHESVISLTKLD